MAVLFVRLWLIHFDGLVSCLLSCPDPDRGGGGGGAGGLDPPGKSQKYRVS